MTEVRVIGAGLAGSEAAWQLAERGFAVRLSEMKPVKMTPAHPVSYTHLDVYKRQVLYYLI